MEVSDQDLQIEHRALHKLLFMCLTVCVETERTSLVRKNSDYNAASLSMMQNCAVFSL